MFEDDGNAALEVGFIINTEGAFAEMLRFAQMFDDKTAQFVRKAAEIETAAGGIKLAGATSSVKAFADTAQRELQTASAAFGDVAAAKEQLDRSLAKSSAMSTFGPAATREAASTRGEINKTERSIDLLIGKLDREAAAVGKTRDELRDMKIETLALTAAQQGNTDAADRLLASARALSAARQAADEDRHALEMAAAAAAAREQASAEAMLNGQLLERARLQAALDRTNGADRPRATAGGATFSALAAKAAEDEARATSVAAAAAKQAADEHARLAAMVRGSQAAMEADAAAAERMRAATDPLYAATKRLNDEIAESTRLYHNGATAPAEYARQQEVLTGRLRAAGKASDELAASNKRGAGTLTQLSFQINDVATMAAMGAKPMQIFASQAGQIFQVAQMAEGGVKGFAKEVGGLALRFLPAIAGLSVLAVGFSRWKDQINDDAGMKKYAESLGLTHKEMKKLGDVSVTTGDIVSGAWKTLQDSLGLAGSGKKLIDYLYGPNDLQQLGGFIASIYGAFVGGYKGIVATWEMLPAAIGDVVSRAAKSTVEAIEAMINGAIDRVNAFAKRANGIIGVDVFGQIGRVSMDTAEIDKAVAAYAGAGKKAGSAFGDNVAAETKKAMTWMKGVAADVAKNATAAAQARLKAKADELIADRTPKKNSGDRHAEQLARDAAAVEAQIKNLYSLADAYGVSGAAALIAEARVKAESQAIKQRGDVEAAVERQVRLAIAQRVSDAAKSTASMIDQARIQEQVNAAVKDGNVPAERAAELLRARMADIPLLAALEAAHQIGNAQAIMKATAALDAQRAARDRLTDAERDAAYVSAMASGKDRLAELREELRLVGATDAARARALAVFKATQEAEAKGWTGQKGADFIAQQARIADETQAIAAATRDWNDALTFTADKWDLVARNIQDAGRGMADAFGSAGKALGDMTSIYADFRAQEERASAIHKANMDAATSTSAKEREQAKYALATANSRVQAYGDMAAAAKGFFKEGSSGYKALTDAEKLFRAVQFAMSVKAIAQDAIETGASLATSAARTAAHAVEAVAKALASLPFPANLAAGAATVAALAAIGVSIAGSFGGGKGNVAPSNTGTGTVLGDKSAQSDSIKNAIDALKEVDTLTNTFAREMAASLKSIDSQIGGVASLVARAGSIDASTGVQTGFKSNATVTLAAIGGIIGGPIGAGIGALLTKIPVIGGILKGLFGSTTSVTGNGLFGKAQTVGSIVNNGFDASYYSDIQKKSKFLGITTGTKNSTQYANADVNLENQFTLILRQFDAAIAAAAGPLGEATSTVQARLNSFVVDIGKIDLKGLTGEQIEDKLSAIFGAAADGMASAAFPAIAAFQKVGEGTFETLVRVASTVEAVSSSLDVLGKSATGMSIAAKLGLADQFDSVSALTSAADAYFQAFYTKEEQAAAKTAQMTRVFGSLGLAMPATLDAFRHLVEAQDLTTAAGQSTYATLLKLAPAFADLQSSMEGARSAADIASERQDLERKLLELRGDTAALRALDLAKLDPSNRALQSQIYAIQDAQDAAKAAEDLRQAWTSVGTSIADEVKRIRGLTTGGAGSGFMALQGQFNAASAAARGGDQDAAKSLPGLSQALLTAAAAAATSRQELDRVQAQTAASLEATNAMIARFAAPGAAAASSTDAIVAAVAATQAASTPAANDDMADKLDALREELAAMRKDNNDANATIATNTGKTSGLLDDVIRPAGGNAIATQAA